MPISAATLCGSSFSTLSNCALASRGPAQLRIAGPQHQRAPAASPGSSRSADSRASTAGAVLVLAPSARRHAGPSTKTSSLSLGSASGPDVRGAFARGDRSRRRSRVTASRCERSPCRGSPLPAPAHRGWSRPSGAPARRHPARDILLLASKMLCASSGIGGKVVQLRARRLHELVARRAQAVQRAPSVLQARRHRLAVRVGRCSGVPAEHQRDERPSWTLPVRLDAGEREHGREHVDEADLRVDADPAQLVDRVAMMSGTCRA